MLAELFSEYKNGTLQEPGINNTDANTTDWIETKVDHQRIERKG